MDKKVYGYKDIRDYLYTPYPYTNAVNLSINRTHSEEFSKNNVKKN